MFYSKKNMYFCSDFRAFLKYSKNDNVFKQHIIRHIKIRHFSLMPFLSKNLAIFTEKFKLKCSRCGVNFYLNSVGKVTPNT